MKSLLIIGAGGHGRVVAEVAGDCGFENIVFLDDNHSDAIGKIDDIELYVGQFEYAFVGIGNNILRRELIDRMEKAGYKIPVLIHPTAYVSRSAEIGKGTIVEPKAIVNANTLVNRGCIISVGAIVDHDVVIGDCCHVNSGAIVKAGATMQPLTKLEAGEVRIGYANMAGKKSEGDNL